MLKHIMILFLFLSLAFPATAQKKLPLGPVLSPRQGKILHQLDKTLSSINYAPPATRPASAFQFRVVGTAMQPAVLPPSTAPIPVLSDEGVSLSDGRTEGKENHSIAPSAVTVLGSPAIARGQDRTITFLRDLARSTSTAEYIPPTERERWKAEFEALRALWIKAEPSDLQNLSNYLTHPVPPATLSYLQREYASLTEQILLAQSRVMPKLIYSFLQNEGRQLDLEDRVYINTTIYKMRMQVSILHKSLNKDPYLLVQQKYWDRMFGSFNPLLTGVLAKPSSIFRQDNRQFVLSEFSLHNPDGSSPYLPKSDSMIAGESMEEEEDDFDEEQYSGQPEAMLRNAARQVAQREHKTQMMQLAQQERDALLEHIPANLRIAVINDDLLPRLNFEGWGKNGYLGENATVETFSSGFSFMKQIKQGKRYDIVITDLVLPDGGVSMMEDFRLLDSKAIVFASSKFYPGDGDDFSARDLFNFGMDGYMWNNTNLNEGAFGYIQYLRQLNNYYYYKNKYGWER